VYKHLEADVRNFVENAKAATAPTYERSVYEYPTSDELLKERARAEAEAAKKADGKGGSGSGSGTGPASQPVAVPTINTADAGVLTLNQTAGGGNCFFHSLFEAQTGRRSTSADQQQQRDAVLSALQANPALTASHFRGNNTPAFNAFATTILLEGQWVGNQTPAIVADALGLRIVIHRPDGQIYFDAVPNAVIGAPQTATVHLYYDGGHYNSYTSPALA
jgi:hypothetical protein